MLFIRRYCVFGLHYAYVSTYAHFINLLMQYRNKPKSAPIGQLNCTSSPLQ